MIYIGYTEQQKNEIIFAYVRKHNIRKTFTISPKKFPLVTEFETDDIEYIHLIDYPVFYRLLQEIDDSTLIVVSECLRTQDRYCLHYNCIRHFLNQTSHQLIFNQLPQIDTQEDFMVLFDFDTQSKWKREKFDTELIHNNSQVFVSDPRIKFNEVSITCSDKTKLKYEQNRKKLFDTLGVRDPHILPRRLYLIPGNDKKLYADTCNTPLFSGTGNTQFFIARNQRLKSKYIDSYNSFDKDRNYTILEFQHRFIDFADFMRDALQFEFDVVTTDLKVDQWYFDRYTEWGNRINETCASL